MIDYEELLELMYLKHHTRKTLAKPAGLTPQAVGRYFAHSLPMPGDLVISIADTLGIAREDIGKFFYRRKEKSA